MGSSSSFFASLVTCSTIDDARQRATKQREEQGSASRKRKLAAEMRKDMEPLLELKRQGKFTEALRYSFEVSGESVIVTMNNPTPYVLNEFWFSVADKQRWDDFQNERYNGVRVADMNTKMRPDWLRKTKFMETWGRVRKETHRSILIAENIPAGSEKRFSFELPPSFRGSKQVTVYLESAIDSHGDRWPSELTIQMRQAMIPD